VIDDLEDSSSPNGGNRVRARVEPEDDPNLQEFTPDELFAMLSEGRAFITLGHLRDWIVTEELMNRSLLSQGDLKRLFLEAGARRGRMDEGTFVNFIDLLTSHISSQESRDTDNDGNDASSDSEVSEGTDKGAPRLVREKASQSPVLIDDSDDVSDNESVFATLAGPHESKVPVDVVLQWASSLPSVVEGAVALDEVRAAVADVVGTDRFVSKRDFGLLEEQLQRFEGFSKPLAQVDTTSHTPLVGEDDHLSQDGTAKDSGEDGVVDLQLDEEVESMESEEVAKQVYTFLAGKKGYVAVKDLYEWDLVKLMVGQDVVTVEQVDELFASMATQVPGKKRKGLDMQTFDRFVDELVRVSAAS